VLLRLEVIESELLVEASDVLPLFAVGSKRLGCIGLGVSFVAQAVALFCDPSLRID